MPESANPTSSGPSLEQILWRAMDRFQERPALIDVEEFADHIEGVFEGEVPAEAWVERFFAGEQKMHQPPADVAEAIVHATSERLHVYEFDLQRLDYVVVEDEKKVVVVSDFGQFALQNDDVVGRALQSAVIPKQQQGGSEPRAYLVRPGGEVLAVDPKKLARSLDQLMLRQVSMPAVDKPGARLAPFGATRRALTADREARALRQDSRTRQSMPAPRPADRPRPDARPAGAQTALFLLMPDGSLIRPEMGSATRWEQMVGRYLRSAAQGNFTVQAGNVAAIVRKDASGTAGERALARSEALSAVRGNAAPVRALDDDQLARALARGAMLVPGLGQGDKFWIQPDAAFKPDRAYAQPPRAEVVRPLRLGELTGDPWADWALASEVLRARTRDGQMPVPPELADRMRGLRGLELGLAGARVVAFRAPDGTLVTHGDNGPIRLAALDRGEGLLPLGAPAAAPGSRSGAVPATALAALQMALERTAAAGGYKLPRVRIESARDALEAGAAMDLSAFDPRRSSVRLAGPASFDGQVARLVLSMPFPNRSELHVGSDLSEALQAYLGAAVQPAGRSPFGALVVDALPYDWGGLHGQATARAQDALMTLDLPMVQPLLARSPSVSGLPLLLQRALADGGSWTPGPGAGVPISIRELASRGPFDAGAAPVPQLRPLHPGEEEIVIPLPLWAQMGRGQLSATDQIMASPLAPAGYAPPLGVYRLVVPGGVPLDMTGGAPSGTPGIVHLSGPTGLELAVPPGQSGAYASSLGGRQFLGRVALDDGDTVVGRSGRLTPPSLDGSYRTRPLAGALTAAPGGTLAVPAGLPPRPAPGPVSAPGSDSAGFEARARAAGQLTGSTGPTGTSSSEGAALGAQAGSALAEMASASSSARRAADQSFVTGLPPGLWSGHRRSSTVGYQGWTYASGNLDRPRSVGGVDLSSLARPIYPSLPTALRFRYVGAPNWWAGAVQGEEDGAAGRALRSGLGAATSAASTWRSILAARPQWGGSSQDLGADPGFGAGEMGGLARRFDALTSAAIAAGQAPGAPAYIGVTGAGAAGTVSRSAAARARASSIEMSIVAAIPPAPPPLESMGSGGAVDAPHARQTRQAHGGGHEHHHDDAETVSRSQIEGSVDAIAQRIYHRIRRRIQSDRERFGG